MTLNTLGHQRPTLSHAALPYLVLCFVPIALHLLELSGFLDTSPLLANTILAQPSGGILTGRPFVDGSGATCTMSLGRLAAENWLHLQLPWWNPFSGIGLPLAGNVQSSSFFLPFVLLLHFNRGILLLKIVMQMLAGCFCYRFLRKLAVSSWASTLGGVLFACNGTFAIYADPSILPIAFLPLLLLGIEHARSGLSRRRADGQTIIALAIAYSLVAGFPETAFVDGLLSFAWALVRCGGLNRAELGRFSARVISGGVLGLALASPALIPFLHNLSMSTFGPFGRNGVLVGMPLRSVPLLIFPYLYGAPMSQPDVEIWNRLGGYLGTTVLLLIPIGAVSVQQSRQTRALLVGWLIVQLGMAVSIPAFTSIASLTPGLNDIVIARYGFPSMSLCACVLVAFALDSMAGPVRPAKMIVALSILVAAMLAALLTASSAPGIGEVGSQPDYWLFVLLLTWEITTPFALAWLATRPNMSQKRLTISAIVIVDASLLFLPPILTGTRDIHLQTAPVVFLQSHAATERTMALGDTLWANAGSYLDIGVLNYFYVPAPTLFARYLTKSLDQYSVQVFYPSLFQSGEQTREMVANHQAALEELAVRYVVAPASVGMSQAWRGPFAPRLAFAQDGTEIYELGGTKPYAETSSACRLTIADREHMQTNCAAPSQLLRRELALPGWQALVDGRRVGVGATREVFQQIEVPAGHSTVTWYYRQPFSRTIAATFAAGVLGLLSINLLARRRLPCAAPPNAP